MVHAILLRVGFLDAMGRYKYSATIALLALSLSCSKIVVRNMETDNSAWPQFGGNTGHTNYVPHNLTPPLVERWQYRASSAVGPSIVSIGRHLFYGTADGKIEGVEIESGKKRGRLKIKNNLAATVIPYKNYLLIVRRISQPTFELYNFETGKSRWKQQGKGLFAEPLLVGDEVYCVDLGGRLICIDLEHGTEKWHLTLDAQSHTTPAYANGTIVVGDDNGKIYAVHMDGSEKWTFESGSAVMATPAVFDNVCYLGTTGGTFYALDLKNGQVIWQQTIESKIYNTPAVSPNRVVFGTTGHKVYCLNRETGVVLWTFEAESGISTAPVIAGSSVYFGSYDQHLYGLNLNHGELLWKYKARGRIISNPIVAGGFLIFASQNDRLYCFEQQ